MAGQLGQYYQDPNLQKAAGEAETAGTQAAAYQSAAALLPSKLKDAINEKMDYNKDIIEQKNKAMSEYFQAPSAARAKYSDPGSENYIFNPFQQEALVSQERAQAYQPFANLTDILQERRGSLADIIQAGTGAFQADVMSKMSAADIANQKYQNLLGIADRLSDARYKEMSLAKSGGSGGGDGLGSIVDWILEQQGAGGDGGGGGGGGIPTPTEEKPRLSETLLNEMRNKPYVLWKSPKGQWVYDFESEDWVPDLSALY